MTACSSLTRMPRAQSARTNNARRSLPSFSAARTMRSYSVCNPTGNVTISASCAVDLSAPVTNLTGTTWYFNDTIDVSAFFNFSITFDSRNAVGDLCTYNKLMVVNDGPESPKLQYGVSVDRYVSGGNAWMFEACRTISITGGTDVANSSLIAWLQANATRTG